MERKGVKKRNAYRHGVCVVVIWNNRFFSRDLFLAVDIVRYVFLRVYISLRWKTPDIRRCYESSESLKWKRN